MSLSENFRRLFFKVMEDRGELDVEKCGKIYDELVKDLNYTDYLKPNDIIRVIRKYISIDRPIPMEKIDLLISEFEKTNIYEVTPPIFRFFSKFEIDTPGELRERFFIDLDIPLYIAINPPAETNWSFFPHFVMRFLNVFNFYQFKNYDRLMVDTLKSMGSVTSDQILEANSEVSRFISEHTCLNRPDEHKCKNYLETLVSDHYICYDKLGRNIYSNVAIHQRHFFMALELEKVHFVEHFYRNSGAIITPELFDPRRGHSSGYIYASLTKLNLRTVKFLVENELFNFSSLPGGTSCRGLVEIILEHLILRRDAESLDYLTDRGLILGVIVRKCQEDLGISTPTIGTHI